MLEEILERRRLAFLNGYFDTASHKAVPQGLEHEYIPGIHREPVAGALRAPGNRRVPESYIFVAGKRVSTGRTSRFAAS
jgi:hypothetical protein